MKTYTLLPVLLAALTSCGGSSSPGDSNVPGRGHGSGGTQDGDNGEGVESPFGADQSDGGVESAVDAPVTFVLTNSAKEDLVLNMDKGWQAVIFAYSGTPPNAKSMLMFPTHCTASCDATPEEICPYCPEPQKVADIKAAEKHDSVPPGESREVPWDGMAYSYQKTKGQQNDPEVRGKVARCKCFTIVEPEPETYTIRACGLRKTKTAKASSQYQCAEGTLTLPIAEPVRVELDFGVAPK